MKEEKKELPTTKMYRKAGNLSRKALSKGLIVKKVVRHRRGQRKLLVLYLLQKKKKDLVK